MILENKFFHKLKLSKDYFYKKCAPQLLFLIEKNNQKKIRMILDSENYLWKSDFGTFWRTVMEWILKVQWFSLSMLIFSQISCFLGPRKLVSQKSKCSLQINITSAKYKLRTGHFFDLNFHTYVIYLIYNELWGFIAYDEILLYYRK